MKTIASIVLLAASATAALAADHTVNCGLDNIPGFPGLTYDISQYVPETGDFDWVDVRNMDTRNMTYVFNLCQNVNQPPSEICGKNGAQKAPAWQYEKETSSCYALGHDAEITPRTFNFKIHDADKPALGFDLQYHSGDSSFCGNNNDVKRSFTISFLCDSNEFDQVSTEPVDHFIRETELCSYEAYSFSFAGCPTQCPIYDGKVCGGNGVCNYDTDMQQARCFCNDGYMSDNGCKHVTIKDNAGGKIAGAAIGGLAMGALGIGAWWYMTQRSKPAQFTDDYAYSGALN